MDRVLRPLPLQIDAVNAPGGGMIGMAICPGQRRQAGASGAGDRNMAADIATIRRWGAAEVVTLMETGEMRSYGVPQLGHAIRAAGLAWRHLPISEGSAPCLLFERSWTDAGATLRDRLLHGERILLHCRLSLGRAGTLAARLLAELGTLPELAIRQVRQARPGTIETEAEAALVQSIRQPATLAQPLWPPPLADWVSFPVWQTCQWLPGTSPPWPASRPPAVSDQG